MADNQTDWRERKKAQAERLAAQTKEREARLEAQAKERQAKQDALRAE